MNGQNWTRKEYGSWDEAFRGLSPIVRQQSVRVAAYTQALYVQACKSGFGSDNPDGQARMRGQYADLAYKCGMYHQLGKALVPPEYQILLDDFTEEEISVYKKYTVDGRALVANLQAKSVRAKEKRQGTLIEQPTQNIPWLMLRESCEQHMERWDGSGYPSERSGDEISPIAQIVGLAKELDRIASETKSENPFDVAYDAIIGGTGSAWSPNLVDVFKAAREECYAVYNKYIAYTRTLPKTIPLVAKLPERSMELVYRPMTTNIDGKDTVIMYEAEPRFAGIANHPGETESANELREMFKRTNLIPDLSKYFLYEVTDAIYRINNCNLKIDGILLDMFPDFYMLNTQLQMFNKLFEDQPIDKKQLWLTIPESLVRNCSKSHLEVICRYLRNGITLVLDGYHPDEQLNAEKLRELGFSHIRFSAELYLKQDTANIMNTMNSQGFVLIGGNADTPDTLAWLNGCGVKCSSGTMTGVPVNEDNMILDSLLREQ